MQCAALGKSYHARRRIYRKRQGGFASEKWPAIADEAWRDARLSAHDKIDFKSDLQILGYDIDAALYVLTADSMFPEYFKRGRPDRVRKLYNGRIRVNYYQYYGERA